MEKNTVNTFREVKNKCGNLNNNSFIKTMKTEKIIKTVTSEN